VSNNSIPAFSLQSLADLLNAELKLFEEKQVTGLASIASANAEQIAFCGSKKFLEHVAISQAAAILITSEVLQALDTNAKQNFLVVPKPELSFAALTKVFSNYPKYEGVHASACIATSVSLGKGVAVGANAVIEEGAVIGDNCMIGSGSVVGAKAALGSGTRLFNNVSIYHEVRIGENCIIHSGAVLGSDGFGFVPGKQGLEKLYQLGTLIVGDNVEIGSNCTLDRGALSNTIIGNGVKMDNQVHIAHNVIVGENTAFAGCTGVAGSTKIGANCQFGGQVAINGHIEICDGVVVTGTGLVIQNITEPGVYSSGIPVIKNADWRRNVIRFSHLSDMAKSIKRLEKTQEKKD
jgi:UDP-3-O-[3-hydroxymyristoyl] glucosamine N-acyltransferase